MNSSILFRSKALIFLVITSYSQTNFSRNYLLKNRNNHYSSGRDNLPISPKTQSIDNPGIKLTILIRPIK